MFERPVVVQDNDLRRTSAWGIELVLRDQDPVLIASAGSAVPRRNNC